MSKHSGGGLRSAMANEEEFEEAEVWEAVHDDDDDHHHNEPRSSNFMMKKSKPSISSARSLLASKKSAIGAYHHQHGCQTQSAGPLLTPGWSHNSTGLSNPNCDDDDGEDEMIPPHEWIARRLARSQISSSSVCEGAGRTLKGRDLSRVRNAVLTKTGFLEQ